MQPNPLFTGLGPFAGLAQAGSQLATRGIQGLFGIKDPEIERRRIYSTLDTTDPTSLRNAAQELAQGGFIDEAAKLATDARKVEAEKAATALTTRATEADIALKTAQKQTEEAKIDPTKGLVKDVQSAKILDDGTTVLLYKNGKREVMNKAGKLVTGDEAVQAIAEAQKYGVSLKGDAVEERLRLRLLLEPSIAGAKTATEIATKSAKEAFTSLSKTKSNIQNLRDAVAAIDKGAVSGPIANMFPNLRDSSIELNNIKNQLGIDVIGSVTFGALSEGELNLALSTAIPDLPTPQLKVWLQNKIVAQEKLSKYLDEQVRFLSRGDKTLGDWLDMAGKKYQPAAGGGGTDTPATPPGGDKPKRPLSTFQIPGK